MLWHGVLGPKGLPKNIVRALERRNPQGESQACLDPEKSELIAEGFSDIDDSPPFSVFRRSFEERCRRSGGTRGKRGEGQARNNESADKGAQL